MMTLSRLKKTLVGASLMSLTVVRKQFTREKFAEIQSIEFDKSHSSLVVDMVPLEFVEDEDILECA